MDFSENIEKLVLMLYKWFNVCMSATAMCGFVSNILNISSCIPAANIKSCWLSKLFFFNCSSPFLMYLEYSSTDKLFGISANLVYKASKNLDLNICLILVSQLNNCCGLVGLSCGRLTNGISFRFCWAIL